MIDWISLKVGRYQKTLINADAKEHKYKEYKL